MEVPSRFEVSDELWAEIEPLIPVRVRRRRHPGRKAIDDRLVLNGILHVLHTGIAWTDLPREYGYGSGVTCWRRLRDWQQAGVWEALYQKLLVKLNAAGVIDWSRASVDGSHVRALFGGLHTGPSPVDRGRNGSKHHLLVDAGGIPLAVSLTGGNRNDVTQLIPLLEDLHARPVAGKVGRPRQKPDVVLADRGYDHDKHRRLVRARGITPVIARRGVAHGSGLGRQRWVVERGFAHLHNFRRLRIRYERRPEIHEAFLSLACAILCFRRLPSF
ncbi:IS5 family transposase [Paraconexibacter antarcticus]|uniref:IS5 family transposase n=1 Tax=Paraconexibacter antarcticus TaxID=2949664 RepID=UPI003F586CF3